MGKKKKTDDDPLLKLEIGKGWKKTVSKFKPAHFAILGLFAIVLYFLVEILKTILDSSLRYNSNIIVGIIILVLFIIFLLTMYGIDTFSEEKKN